MFSLRSEVKILYRFALGLGFLSLVGISILLQSQINIFKARPITTEMVTPFPVSVNSHTKVISENPLVTSFYNDTLANAHHSNNSWWNKVVAIFAGKSWYQNLASPVSRIIVIWPGERKEEVIKHISDILAWNEAERTEFKRLIDSSTPLLKEGKYFPSQYITHRHATPDDIQKLITDSFTTEILNRYTDTVEAHVPIKDSLIIASLLEREASDFANMREISGVIWNRLFINMPLQLDATLQYVKANNTYEPQWWPKVNPADKFLNSSYNTYQNKGLPPAPIANPSSEAVLAALNPIKTDCLFYFHTKNGAYHCSETYEGHVQKLRKIYGRGS